MNDDTILEVADLSIRRGKAHILKHIDWTVRRGEHWVILGANGSGKTSLLKALTGYMMPTEGEISLLGEEFGQSDWRELRKRVGVVSASISHLFQPEDLGLEIVIGGAKAMIGVWGKVDPSEVRRAKRMLGLLRVPELAERPWEVQSQGERQRVLIARALMANPAVLILDEPCAGLDPVARERFLQDLKRLAARRLAPNLVLVTHHVEEILPEFTHLLTLLKGRMVYAGPLQEGLTSAALGKIFSARLELKEAAGRYTMAVLDL